jgi:hypothetical protein
MSGPSEPAPPGSRVGRELAPGTWMVVVARGQGRLATELVELFDHDPRVLVIVDRRQRPSLLPRPPGDVSTAGRP